MSKRNKKMHKHVKNTSESTGNTKKSTKMKLLDRQWVSNSIESIKKPETIGIIITAFIAFIFVHILNSHTGFASDDFKYHFVFDTMGTPKPNTERVNSIWDIVTGMIKHWKLCNGRITAHALLQFFMMFGRPFINFIISIFYVSLGLLVYKHANCYKKHNPLLLVGIFVLLWFTIPDFGASVLWKSGSANYLWMAVIILAFLLPYRLYQNDPSKDKNSNLKLVTMSIFGLFAGCTNENSGGAMILLAIMFIAYYKIKKISIPKWSIAGVVSSILGFVILIAAPGNYRIPSKATFEQLLMRASNVYKQSVTLFFILLIVFVIVLIMYIINKYNSDTKDTYTNANSLFTVASFYLISSVAASAAIILAALQPERTRFCSIVFFIIAIGMIFAEIKFRRKAIISVAMALCVVWFGFSYNTAFKDINITWQQICEEEELIKAAKESGKLDITLTQITKPKSKYNAYMIPDYFYLPKTEWMNQWMAKYYELNSITGVPNK